MKIKDDPDVNSIEMDLLENSKNDKDENEEKISSCCFQNRQS